MKQRTLFNAKQFTGPSRPSSTPPGQPSARKQVQQALVQPGPFAPGNQLPLFMGANDLQRSVTDSYDASDVPMHKMWQGKEAEARMPRSGDVHGSGLYDSMKSQGVTSHVRLALDGPYNTYQFEGHHRLAAAAALERDTGKTVWTSPLFDDDHTEYDYQTNFPHAQGFGRTRYDGN